jgi:hypothetical protein
MAENDHPDVPSQSPQRVTHVVHRIAGGDVVVETFSDGSVRVNGDLVTPARDLSHGDHAGTKAKP